MLCIQQFAFYQTCEVGTRCFFTQGYLTLASQDGFCQQQYGISEKQIQNNVDFSNVVYGGREPAGECVLYPNGEVDPWHSLGVLVQPAPLLPTLFVLGASHHAWTHPSLSSDQPSVVKARQHIRDTVSFFLSQSCDQAA